MHTPRVLLLENIHPLATSLFKEAGFEVENLSIALKPEELIEKARDFDLLGIRSKTNIPAGVFERLDRLVSVGCFCVGTNQVDLEAAEKAGVPVFNAPFSNTRSVAEMTLAEIVMLSRQLGDRNREMHQGEWRKTSAGCFEVRGKTLGIVGYGNIGTQVSMLAEHFGMRVVFYDILSKLSFGNAKPFSSLEELLADADFVTLHVPSTPQTRNMFGARQLEAMKKGACLINASRGDVVDIPALRASLESGHLGGAAIDVFPWEPEGNMKEFQSGLAGLKNVILTPHIGGATEEAQHSIGGEVASTLVRFMKYGTTLRSVNFPSVDSPLAGPGRNRLINIHRNVPGVLREINRILSEFGANILGQSLATDARSGYLIVDLDREVTPDLVTQVQAVKTSMKTRAATA